MWSELSFTKYSVTSWSARGASPLMKNSVSNADTANEKPTRPEPRESSNVPVLRWIKQCTAARLQLSHLTYLYIAAW